MVAPLPILGHFFGAAFLWRVYIRTFRWKVSLGSRSPFLVSDQKELYPLNPISTYEFSRLISIHFFEKLVVRFCLKIKAFFPLMLILLIFVSFLLIMYRYC